MTDDGARGRRLGPDARRAQILDGAMRLFSERSYAAVSTSDLAREIGVARGLVHHYFGTKRELYLEVVRQLATIPTAVIEELPCGTPEERAGAAVDWFLDSVTRHRGLWLAVNTAGDDPEVDAVLSEADEVAVGRVVVALRGETDVPDLLRAHLRSYFGLVRAAAREWLVRGTMDRAQTRALLVGVLVVVLDPDTPPGSHS